MKKSIKRQLAMLLALCMVLTMMPMMAFADKAEVGFAKVTIDGKTYENVYVDDQGEYYEIYLPLDELSKITDFQVKVGGSDEDKSYVKVSLEDVKADEEPAATITVTETGEDNEVIELAELKIYNSTTYIVNVEGEGDLVFAGRETDKPDDKVPGGTTDGWVVRDLTEITDITAVPESGYYVKSFEVNEVAVPEKDEKFVYTDDTKEGTLNTISVVFDVAEDKAVKSDSEAELTLVDADEKATTYKIYIDDVMNSNKRVRYNVYLPMNELNDKSKLTIDGTEINVTGLTLGEDEYALIETEKFDDVWVYNSTAYVVKTAGVGGSVKIGSDKVDAGIDYAWVVRDAGEETLPEFTVINDGYRVVKSDITHSDGTPVTAEKPIDVFEGNLYFIDAEFASKWNKSAEVSVKLRVDKDEYTIYVDDVVKDNGDLDFTAIYLPFNAIDKAEDAKLTITSLETEPVVYGEVILKDKETETALELEHEMDIKLNIMGVDDDGNAVDAGERNAKIYDSVAYVVTFSGNGTLTFAQKVEGSDTEVIKKDELSGSTGWVVRDKKTDTLKAEAAIGYSFSSLTVGGEKVDNDYTLPNTTSDIIPVTVTFKKDSKTSGGSSGGSRTPSTDEDKKDDEKKETDTEKSFSDVKSSDWFAEAVEFVVEEGLFAGMSDTEFGPNVNMTRAMFVTVLGRMADNLGFSTSGNSNTFADVPAGQYYTNYVAWGNANGIIAGYDATTFGTNDNVTREQMAVLFVKFADYANISLKADSPKTFTDAATINSWATASVDAAAAAGLINGYEDGSFRPQGTATRAEVATVFMNFVKNYGDAVGTAADKADDADDAADAE